MARKDLENILRNLYCFLEILQNSRSEAVSGWDKQALDNALQWAAFAEQVYTQSKDKPYQQRLDAEIRKLGQLHWRLGDVEVSLATLHCSKEQLISNLLQNAHVKSELRKYLLSGVRDIDYDRLTEVCSRLLSTPALIDVLTTSQLTSPCDVLPLTSPSDDKSEIKPSRIYEARLLYQSLIHSFTSHSHDEAHLTEKLKVFASCEDGINVIASALNIASSSVLHSGQSHDTAVCEVLVKLILQQIESQQDLLWSVSPALMTQVCCRCSDLHDCYLQYLIRCGECLQPDYENFMVCGRRLKHGWRLKSGSHYPVTYSALRLRLSLLLTAECSRVSSVTLNQLQLLVDHGEVEPNLWKDILSDWHNSVHSSSDTSVVEAKDSCAFSVL